jgi:hypothetical protein
MTVVVIGDNKEKRIEPLKKGFEHMQGKTVKQADYAKHETSDMGYTVAFHVKKLSDILKREGWVNTDDKTMADLKDLYLVLGNFLKRGKK